MDVNNTFLYGDLDKEVYMKIPPGFAKQGEHHVCRIHKFLNGLKQTSHNWFSKFLTVLDAGFSQSKVYHSLFTSCGMSSFTSVLVYVDDIIITGDDPTSISILKCFLHSHFQIKDLGPLKYSLGIEVANSKNGIHLSQQKCALDIFTDVGFLGGRHCEFPMEPNLKLTPDNDTLFTDLVVYRHLVECLLYLTITQPDLAYYVNVLSHFMNTPREPHWQVALRVVRYIKSSPSTGIFFCTTSPLVLTTYSGSDWAACSTTQRSITGYCTFLSTSPISWKSKKQHAVSRSSVEAKYHVMASTACEITWLQ
ncbi:uncharacterized mitochondrial protein AtMg00810-like [Telopea speciosissima]|uniref:uncharacterized mitochondrial protein AtMg00810-like n=1 Tax=Telopea speciosissima TaxID=54955 RepID=UPI001CC480EB|nr:uncharacterized mitochondrial protein AtMg00810-like [Telopea speciosissima]